ncbi:MAG: hypothetical protein QOJ86_2150 [Bradyrhizobium sp.]|jgi:hypothetical protein|nr:hypothetical protein [Bradyrhizobium sp.]
MAAMKHWMMERDALRAVAIYVAANSRAVIVDVMTDGDHGDSEPSKKISELCLELDDLRAIVARYDAKVAAN